MIMRASSLKLCSFGIVAVAALVCSGGAAQAQARNSESAEELLEQINKALTESQPAAATASAPGVSGGGVKDAGGMLPPLASPSQQSGLVASQPKRQTSTGPLNYYGLVPGQSTKADVELLLGDPVETKMDVYAYSPPAEALDASRVEVRYLKEMRVLQWIDVVFRKPLLVAEVTAHAGRRVLVEREANWRWEFYTPSFLAVGSAGAADGAAMFVDRLRYVMPQMVADAFVRRGEKAEADKKIDDAMTEYEKASKIDARYALPYLKLGMMYERAGVKDKALLHYTAATEAAYPIRPKAEGHYRAGRLHDQDRRYDMALKSFHRAVSQDPSYAEGYFGAGRTYHLQEQFENAMASYKKAIALKPDYVVAYDNMGVIYERENKLTAAAQSYEKALLVDSKRGGTWHRLAGVSLRMNEFVKAETAARRRLEQQSDDATAMVQLAMALSSQAPERAALLALFQEDPQLKDALSWLDKAITRGYSDKRELESSAYLQRVREQENRAFTNLLGRIK
jgi:tetratricopeptide (TPR) repeat protein